MKKVLFIDRDGTLITEPSDKQIDSLEKLEFISGVFTWLGKIALETDYELVMVTNQDGLGTKSFPEETFWPAQNKLLKTLEGEGITFKAIHIDKSFPEDSKPTRKPGTGMLTQYFSKDYDLKNIESAFLFPVYVWVRSEEHTSELQSLTNLVCRLLLEKKK